MSAAGLKREKKPIFYWILLLFITLDFILVVAWLKNKHSSPSNEIVSSNASGSYPEINDLSVRSMAFKELSDYFTDLAVRKGAKYSYEVLKIAPIAPNIDMHLLGHVVGDELYKQEGSRGIEVCTDDFRNACSHAIVVGLFSDKGEAALPEIVEACKHAPGGSGAYNMCFHGLGHGILAAMGYEMPKAIDICKKTSDAKVSGREAIECVGGTVMEIIGGGGHDRELWAKQRTKYLKDDDPLYPCDSKFMPDEARSQCYVYLTPHLFQLAGANLASPNEENFKKSFPFCERIPKSEASNRRVCYGGFGKEFVVLAKARDIRNIEKMTNEELLKVYRWCKLAGASDGVNFCLISAVNSLYWGGENDREVAIRFCNLIDDSSSQSLCFSNLIGAVRTYIKDINYKEQFCSEIPSSYNSECQKILN